jgi:hypothetical protein
MKRQLVELRGDNNAQTTPDFVGKRLRHHFAYGTPVAGLTDARDERVSNC